MRPEEKDYYSYLSFYGGEEYLAIPGYEGAYEVSNMGNVRSVTRQVKENSGRTTAVTGIQRKIVLDSQGYPSLTLSKNGVMENKRISALVLLAFVGPRPEKMDCCHNNGNRNDNSLCNLRYDTHKANCKDKERHETSIRLPGKDSPLNVRQIIEVKERLNKGQSLKKICQEMAVPKYAVAGILYQSDWSRIGPPLQPRGKQLNGKLTLMQVRQIKALLAKGESQRIIAKKFSVTPSAVGQISRGITWKNA